MNKKINVSDSVTVEKPNPISSNIKERAKEKLQKLMKEELKMVKGIFQFFECPGMAAKITIKKYKDHFFSQEMMDGQEYEIPLYVARFLNGIDATAEGINGKLNTCSYPVHSYLMDKNGVPIVAANKYIRRFGFQSNEFAGPISQEKMAA